MPFIPPAQLERVKKIDLLTYLKYNEPEELVRISPNVYSTRSHDSLKISNGLWHQWSTGIGGRSALDYLIKIRGMSLPEAVLTIDSGTVTRPSFSYAREPPKTPKFSLPERSDTNDRLIKYLLERGIDRNVIIELIESGRIYEEKDYHNVVFVGVDANGIPRHAAIRASNNSRFMIDAEGSAKEYSFSLAGSAESRELHVFEGAIDLLSYCTLEKMYGHDWKAAHMLSLSGVSKERTSYLPLALKQYLADHPKIRSIHLHFDNDRAGRNAAEAIYDALPCEYKCFDEPPLHGKDYNDFLKQKLSIKTRSDAR